MGAAVCSALCTGVCRGSDCGNFGVVPWNINTIGNAVRFCYWTAREAVPDIDKLRSSGMTTLRSKLSDSRLILDLKRSGHNISWTPDQAESAQIFRRSDANGTCFVVARSTFEQWFESKLQAELVLRELERQGLLLKSKRGLRTTQLSIAGIQGKGYYYCISEAPR